LGVPEDLSAAEIRAEIVAQFQAAFPEYRLLKVIPAPDERPRRRQSFRNEPNATMIGTATEPASTPVLIDDERTQSLTLIGTVTDLAKAAHLAALVAPYRHARLSAVKLAGDPNNPLRIKDDATADELREEIMRRLAVLCDHLPRQIGLWHPPTASRFR
jgi:hypothetical protein